MIVEVVNTGTELLLGDIINTNFQFLTKLLNEKGFDVLYQTTVGDNPGRLASVLQIALSRADIVIFTGGLGPTRGDITTEVIAGELNLKLELHEESLEKIKGYFAQRHMVMAENNIKQAMLPVSSSVLTNNCGTAPGWAARSAKGKIVILLPGPPREMKEMAQNQMLPYLESQIQGLGTIHSKVLHLAGLGESTLAEMLDDIITSQTNPTIAIYARNGELIIRITAKGHDLAEAKNLIAGMEREVRTRLETYIFAEDESSLAKALGEELLQQGKTIALAESCTGGLASSLLTDIPGSSAYLLGSVVTYSNMAKNKLINVSAADLEKYGAVSSIVACQMAEGVRKVVGTDIGVGITGIAGPGGATPTKPVGLVYIAVSDGNKTDCKENFFKGNRENNKLRSATTAFYMALKLLREEKGN